MADHTIRLNAIKTAYEDWRDDGTASGSSKFYHNNTLIMSNYVHSTGGFNSYRKEMAYIGFEPLPDEYSKKFVRLGKVYLYVTSAAKSIDDSFYNTFKITTIPIVNNWNEDTINSDNRPEFLTNNTTAAETLYGNLTANAYYKANIKIYDDERREILTGISIKVGNSLLYTGGYVTISANSRLASNIPYLELIAGDVLNTPVGTLHTSGFANEKEPIEIGWDIKYYYISDNGEKANLRITARAQKNATIKWKNKGSSFENIIENIGENQRYTFQANTFSADSIEWCVRVMSDDDVWGDYSEWYELTTVDVLPTSRPISPVNAYIDTTSDNLFEWQHDIGTGTSQSKFDLQYSTDGSMWIDLASEETDRCSYLLPKGTLPTGKLFWRVRTYNTDGAAGEWSNPASIIGIGKPKAPGITGITNQARPKISWQADDQIAYQVEVYSGASLLIDSMETAGSTKLYRIPEYLNDGRYTFRVRIKNSNGQLSDWSSASANISTVKPKPPIVTGHAVENAAYITAQLAEEVSTAYLLRDGVPIAKFTGAYYDYGEIGEHEYAIRAINADDNFVDSDPVFITINIGRVAQIAPEDDLTKIVRLQFRRGEPAMLSAEMEPAGESMNFAGRKFPIYEFGEFLSESYDSSFSVRTREEWDRIKELAISRKTVLYRDVRGNCFYGIISALQFDQDRYSTDFSISLLRVDHVGRIEYDPAEV
ncbi:MULTISPECIES: hypothetical protein [Anaerotruncus]|uniref:Fibronectin type-III domain-containing protein n=1 Tax=Anaerotruncus massiliensis (ex Togo et al. 2019) TaxID=1673720 RepID=A0ABR7ADJ8_9FIRM|nr:MULTISPECIES: hypothetical protein [Anaerotruncus]MBC3938517.1 hypothetical protein [Anaerotruncus massiliensis (ex Togo et al. 2019)]